MLIQRLYKGLVLFNSLREIRMLFKKTQHSLAAIALCLFLFAFVQLEGETDIFFGNILLGLSALTAIASFIVAGVHWYKYRKKR